MKTKKSLYSICLVVLLIISSLLLFACGGNATAKNAYKSYSSLLTEMKQDSKLFSTKDVNGVETNFYFNDFFSKDENNNPEVEYEYYITLSSISLDFIDEYHVVLQNAKIDTDHAKLVEDVKQLKKKYNNLKKEYENLSTNANGLDDTVYNGYFSRYKWGVLKFINESYECSLSLGKFLQKKFNFDQAELNFTVDFNLLKVFNDYRQFLLSSCKGINLSSEDSKFEYVLSQLQSWQTTFNVENFKTLDKEDEDALKTVFARVDGDRKLASKAMSKFSYLKFIEEYETSVKAYSKSNENASSYYSRLNDYLFSDGTLESLKEYLEAKLI